MLEYLSNPLLIARKDKIEVNSFISENDLNLDKKTVTSFGEEWNEFDTFDDKEIEFIGNEYFDIVNDTHLNKESLVLDVGCGTGRWSRYLADKVKFIEGIDPSDAVFNAITFNKDIENIRITKAGVDSIPFKDEAFDFVFSLGVLHHIPDTQKAMQNCVDKLKQDGYFLVYLYYKFDNRGFLFKFLFFCSNLFRLIISKMPFKLKKFTCIFLAYLIYFPFAKLGLFLKKMFPKQTFYKKIPLFYYHDKSFHIMKNDSLDRFGTPLEQRFTKKEITSMMENCGLIEIVFSDSTPYWHARGRKSKSLN